MTQIGIFPASGALGTSTYTHLLSQVSNDLVTLINRYPEKVPKRYVDNGTTVRQASYESSSEELEAAFAGVDVLFLISYPSHVHQYRTKVQTKALDAAVKAGVKHIFYSSLGFASINKDSTKAEVMGAHLDSEAHLRELADNHSGFSWTSIREGLYSESFPIYTSFLDLKNPPSKILIPHDGSGPGVSWVKRDELGEATAHLIASYTNSPSSFKYTNQIVTLTGSTSWTLAETIEVLSRAAGKAFQIQEISVDEYVDLPQIKEYFGSEEKARTWATAWEAIRAGETAPVTSTMKEILGREPEPFEKTIEEFAKRTKSG
ncbi:related to NmrA-like family protein [Fusarium torulosum]|uniref:Related to NmrA-like family protein n=1 Tax=Fusarium torulosum TaxID=33205 RepID=A0AAE8M8D9_9HYPO|nr:related to NmrA-like family protein [Fusarium torulosum]